MVEIPPIVWQPILRGIILQHPAEKSAHAYSQVWTRGGLAARRDHPRARRRRWQGAFGDEVIVDHAMRYGQPAIAERLDALKAQGCERILIAPLYPQYCAATTATANDAAFAASAPTMRWQPAIRTLPPYHDDPAYIDALKASVEAALAALDFEPRGDPRQLPRHAAADARAGRSLSLPLPEDGAAAVRGARARAGGRLPVALRPGEMAGAGDRRDARARLPGEGVTKVAIFAPGFSADCLETLEELAIRGRDTFLAAGGDRFRLSALPQRQRRGHGNAAQH